MPLLSSTQSGLPDCYTGRTFQLALIVVFFIRKECLFVFTQAISCFLYFCLWNSSAFPLPLFKHRLNSWIALTMTVLGNGISFIYFVDCPYFRMDSIFFCLLTLKKKHPTDSITFLPHYPFFKYFSFLCFLQKVLSHGSLKKIFETESFMPFCEIAHSYQHMLNASCYCKESLYRKIATASTGYSKIYWHLKIF